MANKLEEFFKKDEFPKVEDKIKNDENLKEKYEKIKNDPNYKMAQLRERIETKTESNFEKRFEAFKKAVLEAEEQNLVEQAKSKVEETKDDLTKKAEEKVKEVKDKATKTVLEKTGLGAMWEKVSGMFDKISGLFDSLWKKITAALAGTGIGAFFGFKKEEETEESTTKNEEDESTEKTKKQLEKGKVETKPKLEEKENEKVDTNIETIEKSKDRYYKFGRLFVKKLGNETFTSKDDFSLITNNIKDKKYYELKDYTVEKYNNEFNSKITKENFNKIKDNILGNDMRIFFSSAINKEKIKELTKIEKFNNILIDLGIDKENIDWEKLSLEKVFILFSLIISTEIIVGMKSIPGMSKIVFNQFLEIKDNFPGFEEIEKDLKELEEKYEKEVMPKELIEKLFKIDGRNEHGSYSWEIDNKIFKNINEDEKKYLDKVFKFKENFNKNILENNKYSFNEKRKQQINSQINFEDILGLYLSTKGELNTNDEFCNIKIRGLLALISRKDNEHGEYTLEYKKYINSITNKEDKKREELPQLIVEKIMNKLFIDPAKNNAVAIGKATIEFAKNNPVETGIGAVFLTLIGKTYGKTLMKIKTLFYIGGASALISGYFYLKNNGISKNAREPLKKAIETIQPNTKETLDKIDSGEYKGIDDYKKDIEKKYTILSEKEIDSNLGKLKIEGNKIFFIDKNKSKFELKFENEIHSLAKMFNSDFGKNISKWTFSFESINFVKKDNKYFININNDYYLDLNTIKKNGEKYEITVGETSQESITTDLSSAKDLILDGFYFEKIKTEN